MSIRSATPVAADSPNWIRQFVQLFRQHPYDLDLMTHCQANEYCYQNRPDMFPRRVAREAAERREARIAEEKRLYDIKQDAFNSVFIPHSDMNAHVPEACKKSPGTTGITGWTPQRGADSALESFHFLADFDIESIVAHECSEVDDSFDWDYMPSFLNYTSFNGDLPWVAPHG